MSENALEVRDLTKRFGDFVAVNGLSFNVSRGEIVGLLGVNGAGKTTVMNMLLGLVTPTSGSIEALGMDMPKDRVEILKRTNFSSAYTQLPGNLLVWQNLKVFGHLYGVPGLKKKVNELLEHFQISHLKDRVTGRLSAGEATRVNLCKSLLNNPDLLLLDEPTASLDPDVADLVRKAIREIQSERGISVLYTSHNMRDIEEVCDRVIFIHSGRIVREGTPGQIMQEAGASMEDVFIEIARNQHPEKQAEMPHLATTDPPENLEL